MGTDQTTVTIAADLWFVTAIYRPFADPWPAVRQYRLRGQWRAERPARWPGREECCHIRAE